MVTSDAELNHWAERFIAGNVRESMPFEVFMSMTAARRERVLAHQAMVDETRRKVEQTLPLSTTAHGGALVAPMKPTLRRMRRPWFFFAR